MIPPISLTSGFPKCINPKRTDDKNRAIPRFFEKKAKNCIKYPLKKYSSKLVCIGIRTIAIRKRTKNDAGLNCTSKSSGCNIIVIPVANKKKPVHNTKENRIRLQSTFGRAVVSFFIEYL